MGVITGITYTPLFLLPSMSILPMDLNRGQTGLFCILHLKDLSTKGTIFQLYDANLYCTAIYGSTYFFHYMNSKHFQWSLHQSAVQNFSRKSGVPLFGQRCIEIRFHSASASTSLGTTLTTEYVNFERKCRFAAWLARLASRSNPADQPSR
jgi:hypothetical protein